MNKKIFKFITVLMACFVLLSSGPLPCAEASYRTGFNSSEIQIITPASSGLSCEGELLVKGTSSLDEVWFCARGPENELCTYKTPVVNGNFEINLSLRFGSGKYTVWADNNPQRFDGTIRFLVNNESNADIRYTAPSTYVDSENDAIVKLLDSLNIENLNDMQKIQKIHDWITRNISYDCEAYYSQKNEIITASQVLQQKKGMCRDYSFLFAALCRASGIPCRIIYGQASPDASRTTELHAWNEALVDGKWVSLDVTWDAGYINSRQQFVFAPTNKYFACNPETFSLSHTMTMIAVH